MSAPRTRGYEEGEGMDGADGPCHSVPPKFDSGALWGRGSEGGVGCAGRRRGDTRRARGATRKLHASRGGEIRAAAGRADGVPFACARRRLMRGWRWEARVKGGGRNGRAHCKQDGTHRKARGRTMALYIAYVGTASFSGSKSWLRLRCAVKREICV
ncbi:hypothetical protein B0H16DRAFT_1620317, partial [Mycena metata]